MSYTISAHKLVGPAVAYAATKKRSGKMTPKFLVLHYTASNNYAADVAVLSSSAAQASAHLVVAPDGRVTQIGDFRDALWHAGQSAWRGYSGLNQHSIGIEVTCPGPIDYDQARYASLKDGEPYRLTTGPEPRTGRSRRWAMFTDEQVAVVREVGILLMRHYGLLEAVGHHQIAPTRKIDPGPSCPDAIYAYLNGNRESETPVERPDLQGSETLVVAGLPSGDTLNFRTAPNGPTWPGSKGLPETTPVVVLDRSGKWVQVRTPYGSVGWVWGDYLRAA